MSPHRLPSPPLSLSLLLALTLALAASPALADPPALTPLPAPPPPPPDETRALRFTGGVSLTAVGGIGLILSGVMGVRALVSKNEIGTHCAPSGTCDLTGYTYGSQAQDFALTSTIFFTGGVLVAATGVALLLSAKPWQPGIGPRASRASAWIVPTPSGAAVAGRW